MTPSDDVLIGFLVWDFAAPRLQAIPKACTQNHDIDTKAHPVDPLSYGNGEDGPRGDFCLPQRHFLSSNPLSSFDNNTLLSLPLQRYSRRARLGINNHVSVSLTALYNTFSSAIARVQAFLRAHACLPRLDTQFRAFPVVGAPSGFLTDDLDQSTSLHVSFATLLGASYIDIPPLRFADKDKHAARLVSPAATPGPLASTIHSKMSTSKVGHTLAKGLGIKLDYRNPTNDKLTRGESTFSVGSADSYLEDEPHVADWFRSITPTGRQVGRYFYDLFPFLHWIGRYNLQWFAGDLVAGITIGAVVVPQGMAYASLAELPPQFGLYSSFMGVLLYWFFATSKDITIGPVAVMSTVTGEVILHAQTIEPNVPPHIIATALSVICGGVICFIGLARLGWLVELIPLVAIAAYMTGSALFIAIGQVPTLLGISDYFDTRQHSYWVVIKTLRNLPNCNLDAAMGLTALFMLYLIRWSLNTLARKQPAKRKLWFFLNTMRSVFVILLYTFISAMVNLNLPDRSADSADAAPFSLVGPVPRGFQNAAVPKMNSNIVSMFVSYIPVSVIVILIEHISIAKSFGRVNNYTINPSQEMVAIGITNLLGPFLGAYPATGSFSRTAIKSKAGVRTPFAGFITAMVVLLAIYALPVVFFYIPKASLAAIIIHAVGDLITPPNTVYQFWRTSPMEVPIFFAGVFVTIFSSIENGIYVTITCSMALYLFRAFKAQGRFLGKVKVHSVIGDHLIETNDGRIMNARNPDNDPDAGVRNIFLPITNEDGSNPLIKPEHPYPGIFIYRFSEGFNYPNANHYTDYLLDTIFKETQRTNPNSYGRQGDRPWNDPGPRRGQEHVDHGRPHLKAIILDFASVNNVDLTSVQNLIDVRNQLDRYAAPDKVQWHFAHINNRWTKRALASAGFGFATPEDDENFSRWKPLFSVAELGGSDSAAAEAERRVNRVLSHEPKAEEDVEQGHMRQVTSREIDSINEDSERNSQYDEKFRMGKAAVVQGLNRPFFHMDLTSALQSAIQNIETLKVKPEQSEPVGDKGE
ncbi:uncharacterized protein LTR77_003830 [Saxophila tyrrhenica]|uniref:STAS domain-containing protein n=1 Tax=Saxophila tyrrhenica TaxID=1690608 RepID=A0AAV9PGC0_9PEZI|nr:hypothetical protein LTR77_003830 [Saxophila tyrrhenica]